MKMRILSQLYGMWKGLPDSQTYLNRIATDLGMPPRMVAQQAGTALQLLYAQHGSTPMLKVMLWLLACKLQRLRLLTLKSNFATA